MEEKSAGAEIEGEIEGDERGWSVWRGATRKRNRENEDE